jgi:hypothetical protein
MMCQRYYQKVSSALAGSGYQQYAILNFESSTTGWGPLFLKTTMRAQPSLTTSGSFQTNVGVGGSAGTIILDTNQSGVDVVGIGMSSGSGYTAGQTTYLRSSASTSGYIAMSAEL